MSSHNVFHASGRRFNYSGKISDNGESSSIGCDSPDRFLPILTSRIPLHADAGIKTSEYSAKLLAVLDSTYEQHPQASSDHTLLSRLCHTESLNIKKTPVPSRYSAAQNACSKADFVIDTQYKDKYPPHPCAWSCQGVIAFSLNSDLYVQRYGMGGVGYCIRNLEQGSRSVEWLPDHTLAVGGIAGSVFLFDADKRLVKTTWKTSVEGVTAEDDEQTEFSIDTLHFSKERGILAAARNMEGSVVGYDPRMRRQVWEIKKMAGGGGTSVKWSPDGLYLAVGGNFGFVNYLDYRAFKTVTPCLPREHTKYSRPYCATNIAWAPWEPHLLASTGVTDRDCRVHFWSLSGSDGSNNGYRYLHSAIFSSEITSLHFSPHVTELLFTYGGVIKKKEDAVLAPESSRRRGSRTVPQPPPPEILRGMAVHSYPSLQRVYSAEVHNGTVVDSVLSCDGTMLLTYGTDERVRTWKIWGERKKEKLPTMMDKMIIR